MKCVSALLVLAATPLVAQIDVFGSSDPTMIERYPRSWIVQFREIGELQPYNFISAPVEKIKREVLFEAAQRLPAVWKEVTYEIPSGVERGEAVAHYLTEIDRSGGTVAFQCDGRDCGRGTTWAIDVLQQPKLASPDRNQSYIAASWPAQAGEFQQVLAAIYIVKRGNGRVFAHVEEISSTELAQFDPNSKIETELAKNGIARILGVVPEPDGSLADEDLAVIRSLAARLNQFGSQSVYAVCHIFAVQSVESLIEASNQCAASVAAELSNHSSVEVLAFGAGPLVPASGHGETRVELVIPARISRGR